MSRDKNFKLFSFIILTWLIAGTLDGLAALFILAKGNTIVFKYVASAVYGEAAFAGGTGMVWAGVAFHYIVAAGVTTFYFLLYGMSPAFKKNKILMTICYGVFVWVMMNVVIVKLTNAHPAPISLQGAAKNILILIFCVALPIVLMRERYERLVLNKPQ
jgi:hypothetical protein